MRRHSEIGRTAGDGGAGAASTSLEGVMRGEMWVCADTSGDPVGSSRTVDTWSTWSTGP